MSEISVYDTQPFEIMEQVAGLAMKGKSELAIARELKIKRVEVINHLNRWRDLLTNDQEARDIARDHLNQMVAHYDSLIAKSYELLAELEVMDLTHQLGSVRAGIIKNIAELDAKRVDLLQKAGLLAGEELGEQLAVAEERQRALIDILKNDLCVECTATVKRRLQEITQVETVRVV